MGKAYKSMSKEELEAEMEDSDVTEIKTSVLREYYDGKLRE